MNPNFNQTLLQTDVLFTENDLSAITGFETITGISDDTFTIRISIYPNPTSGVINVIGLDANAKINILDAKGQMLLTDSGIPSDLITIDLSSHQPGVYFIRIEINEQHIYRKLVLI
ncbi:MAG TPA: T9SS type A sorting domain-containing protein [Bacteroidales bacterium]|nr:T9SS type A sorting domain-containing protein [Bacteroidales bacterium]MBP7875143.1 T9SS type A sorting domain-containing protein [Bacteroidales bacterium]MCZ2283147.1 T9SS type A sorting domain-containing protein [Bacteroidales bacterium]HPX34941.1 T9SS type A sorting domain-containing protein [Bacteroidales bacterium]